MKANESKFAAVRLEKSKLMAAIAVLAVAFVVLAAVPAVDVTGEDGSTPAKVAQIGDEKYTLEEAIKKINEATSGDITLRILADMEVDATASNVNEDAPIKITNNNVKVIIDGGNHVVKAKAIASGTPGNIILVTGAKDVVIKDLVIDGNSVGDAENDKSGINVYQSVVTLSNVTSKNNEAAGMIVGNNSTVTASNITMTGNGWYAINVAKGQASSGTQKLILEGSNDLGDAIQIMSEDAFGSNPVSTVESNDQEMFGYKDTTASGWNTETGAIWFEDGIVNIPVPATTTITIPAGKILQIASEFKGTVAGAGKVVLLAGGDISEAKEISNTGGVSRSDDDTGMSTAGVNGSIDTP